jgi:hypothetical protein
MLAALRAIPTILRLGAKYGPRFVSWVWGHKGTIANWLGGGYSVYSIVGEIARLLGY